MNPYPEQDWSTALPDSVREFLREAADYLEHPTFLLRIAGLVGKPAEMVLAALPRLASQLVVDATHSALTGSLDWAVRSLPESQRTGQGSARPAASRSELSPRLHTVLTATTGAVGGFFGLPGLAMELPATTMLMLRSIAQIAAEEGADVNDPAVRLQCLSVFSFGSPSLETMDSAYFTARLGMAMAVKDATTYVAKQGVRGVTEAVTKGTAPVLVRLINQIASRFQIVVTQKAAAQAVPIAGAASGALINAAFTDHFNTVARFHFRIVELERLYGREAIQTAYLEARTANQASSRD